jgi:hypothetical protein
LIPFTIFKEISMRLTIYAVSPKGEPLPNMPEANLDMVTVQLLQGILDGSITSISAMPDATTWKQLNQLAVFFQLSHHYCTSSRVQRDHT